MNEKVARMSNIPKNRKHLLELIDKHSAKLWLLIDELSEQQGKMKVDEDFSIKDIIVIRIWWLSSVQKWIKDGQKGKSFPLPAEGYSWQETPALNLAIAHQNKSQTLSESRKKLKQSLSRLLKLIESLSDQELTQKDQFEWTGKWPLMRWISVSSSSQFDGAVKLIRKALKS